MGPAARKMETIEAIPALAPIWDQVPIPLRTELMAWVTRTKPTMRNWEQHLAEEAAERAK